MPWPMISAPWARQSKRAMPRLTTKADRSHLDESLARYTESRSGLDRLAQGTPGRKPIHPQYLARLVSEAAAGDAVFTFDVGTPTIWAARRLMAHDDLD